MKISVITPSYNQGQFIERTIQSVLDQHAPFIQLEYIVIDGGSTDDTLSILRSYSEKLQFISEADRGQTHAINKGIRLSSGDIIGWVNSDDIYYPDAIKTACDFFNQHPEVDILYGYANHIDEHDQVINRYPVEPYCFATLKTRCYISQPAVFFRREVFKQFGWLDETLNYCMDYEYWIRLSKQGAKFACLPKLMAGARLHQASKTLSQSVAMQKEVIAMLKKHLHTVPPRWFLTYAYVVFRNKTTWTTLLLPVLVFSLAARECIRWNGWLKGSVDVFLLPLVAAKLLYFKQALRRAEKM